jgi:hypothetical protein
MRPIHHLVIAGLALALANCSTHPLVSDVTRSTTADIVKHIRCEAKRAVINDERMSGRSANTISAIAYEFDFQITENNNAAGSLTGQIPVPNGGFFSLSANADSELQRFSSRNFRIVDTFEDLKKANCARETLEKNVLYPIGGEVGVYEVVTTFAKLQRLATLGAPISSSPPTSDLPPGFSPSNEPEGETAQGTFRFADTLIFTTTLNGGVNPTLTLAQVTNSFRVTGVNTGSVPGPDPAVSGLTPLGAGLNAQRQDMHKVVISIAGLPKKTDSTRRSSARMNAPLSNHAIISTTSIQLEATAKERALYELDRQRMLALQRQSPNLLVTP